MSIYDALLFVDREKKFRGFQKLLQPATRQAIMLIEAPQDMGKTWLIGKIQHYCNEPDTNVPVAQVDFRNPLQLHEIQDELSLMRFIRDRLGHSRYFNNLNATINGFTDVSVNISSGLGTLRQNIERYFNLDELNNLAFDLGINYENLSGQTLQAKSRELVNYCQRHNLLRALVERCIELRSQVDWWPGLESLRQEPTVAVSVDEPVALVVDNDAPIWADTDMERRRALRQINSAFFECLASLLADKEQVALLFD
jgi:hypothetical protein